MLFIIVFYESQINDFCEFCYNFCFKINIFFGIGFQVIFFDFFKNVYVCERGVLGIIFWFFYYLFYIDIFDVNCEEDVCVGVYFDYGFMIFFFCFKGQVGLEILI